MVELVLQCLLQLVADSALGVRAADVQRHLVHPLHLVRDLRSPQDEPHLGPIAVPDDEVPPFGDHVSKVVRRVAKRLLLVLDSGMPGVTDQGIAANGDHRHLLCAVHAGSIPPPRRSKE